MVALIPFITEIPFLRSVSPKIQNCQFKLEFCTKAFFLDYIKFDSEAIKIKSHKSFHFFLLEINCHVVVFSDKLHFFK